MNYYNLKSIFAANKKTFSMRSMTESLYIAQNRDKPYIEPTLAKVEFSTEKPKVILVSAVGATGKTALAQVLSNETGLPVLDLSKHKPVGDNTLTGIITTSFKTEELSQIFLGLANGTYGVIIDGVDEGRSKTTEKAFEAFLDNICQLCSNSTGTSFVLLGRTKILDDCWLYLTEKGIDTGLVSILPFDLDSAKKYIDQYVNIGDEKNKSQYDDARNHILSMLGSAFISKDNNDFLSFIGYPPVLDAIVTLLSEEKNYFKLLTQIQHSDGHDIEIELLVRIANYILQREKEQKVKVNILTPLLADMPSHLKEQIFNVAFEAEEQCVRLISYCLNRDISLQKIKEPILNEKYEEALRSFFPEHPFISGRNFRNVVFEAVAVATLMTSELPECKQLVLEYLHSQKYSYHLIYLLSIFAKDGHLPVDYLHILIGSALEFISTNTSVEINVGGLDVEDTLPAPFSIEIEILLGRDRSTSKIFNFYSNLYEDITVNLGARLSRTYVSLPCNVSLTGKQEIELTAPVEILANNIVLNASSLVVKHVQSKEKELTPDILLQAQTIRSNLESIISNGVTLILAANETNELAFPAIQYAEKRAQLPTDPKIKEKYIRLRRILMEFRSHSKGAMAKYKGKIEHERVLRNNIGYAILQRLLTDQVLTMSGVMYYLNPDEIDTNLGISWTDLRKGKTSDRLLQYLRSIKIG